MYCNYSVNEDPVIFQDGSPIFRSNLALIVSLDEISLSYRSHFAFTFVLSSFASYGLNPLLIAIKFP